MSIFSTSLTCSGSLKSLNLLALQMLTATKKNKTFQLYSHMQDQVVLHKLIKSFQNQFSKISYKTKCIMIFVCCGAGDPLMRMTNH